MTYWKRFAGTMVVALCLLWGTGVWANEIVIGYSGPLSGPAAEYGQDCANGIDMAVKEINEAGGVTVQGENYTFKFIRLDDRVDATQARNNAMRLVNQEGAIAVFNPIATTIGSIMTIPDQDFIIAAYSSVHTIMDMGHPMIINPVPNFVTYAVNMADIGRERGWERGAMVVTLGAYGDAWRSVFKKVWESKGGTIVGDFPANYYTEVDFSSQLSSAINKDPDFMLIGGPSATSALMIEQARGMGFKGGFILIDQAKPDYIAKVIGDTSMLEGMISTGAITALPMPGIQDYAERYSEVYVRDLTSEAALNYNVMHIIARAIKAADSIDPVVIRQNIHKALPTDGNEFPNELFGIADNGYMYCGNIMQVFEDGEFSKIDYVLSFPKTEEAFQKYKAMSASLEPELIRWVPLPF